MSTSATKRPRRPRVAKALADLAADVPSTATDLTGYSVRLFEYLCAHPQVLRLTTWAQLERPLPTPAEIETYRPKVAAIAAAQESGDITAIIDPVDLLAFTISTATAWANASTALRSLSPEPSDSQARIKKHREAVANVERSIVSSAH